MVEKKCSSNSEASIHVQARYIGVRHVSDTNTCPTDPVRVGYISGELKKTEIIFQYVSSMRTTRYRYVSKLFKFKNPNPFVLSSSSTWDHDWNCFFIVELKETLGLYLSRFWRGSLSPTLLSSRRSISDDALLSTSHLHWIHLLSVMYSLAKQ